MKKITVSAIAAAILAMSSAPVFGQTIESDPAADADCVIALMLLGDSSDDKSTEDAIFTMTMYYYGRLGGEGSANAAYLASRVGRFIDDETLYLTEAQQCATDFETEVSKFDQLARIFE